MYKTTNLPAKTTKQPNNQTTKQPNNLATLQPVGATNQLAEMSAQQTDFVDRQVGQSQYSLLAHLPGKDDPLNQIRHLEYAKPPIVLPSKPPRPVVQQHRLASHFDLDKKPVYATIWNAQTVNEQHAQAKRVDPAQQTRVDEQSSKIINKQPVVLTQKVQLSMIEPGQSQPRPNQDLNRLPNVPSMETDTQRQISMAHWYAKQYHTTDKNATYFNRLERSQPVKFQFDHTVQSDMWRSSTTHRVLGVRELADRQLDSSTHVAPPRQFDEHHTDYVLHNNLLAEKQNTHTPGPSNDVSLHHYLPDQHMVSGQHDQNHQPLYNTRLADLASNDLQIDESLADIQEESGWY
jgi:hypothetical protein